MWFWGFRRDFFMGTWKHRNVFNFAMWLLWPQMPGTSQAVCMSSLWSCCDFSVRCHFYYDGPSKYLTSEVGVSVGLLATKDGMQLNLLLNFKPEFQCLCSRCVICDSKLHLLYLHFKGLSYSQIWYCLSLSKCLHSNVDVLILNGLLKHQPSLKFCVVQLMSIVFYTNTNNENYKFTFWLNTEEHW